MDTEDILEDIYYTPSSTGSLGGVERLYSEAKKRIRRITRAAVEEFLEKQYTYTRHRSFNSKFQRRKVLALDICDVYQMDLVDLQKFASHNDG